MRNARLDKAQAGIKIAGRNINNLRYAEKGFFLFVLFCFFFFFFSEQRSGTDVSNAPSAQPLSNDIKGALCMTAGLTFILAACGP